MEGGKFPAERKEVQLANGVEWQRSAQEEIIALMSYTLVIGSLQMLSLLYP